MTTKLSMSALLEYLRARKERTVDPDETAEPGVRLATALEQLTDEIRASSALRHALRSEPKSLHVVPFGVQPLEPANEGKLRSGRAAIRAKMVANTHVDEMLPVYFIVDPTCDCSFYIEQQHQAVIDEAHSSMFWPGRIASETPLDCFMWCGRQPHQQPDVMIEADAYVDPRTGETILRARPLHGIVLAEARPLPRHSVCGQPGFR